MPRRSIAEPESPLAAQALRMAAAGDLDPSPLTARACKLGRDGDGVFPLSFARAQVLGRLDRTPGDNTLTLALGLLAAATSDWAARKPDDP